MPCNRRDASAENPAFLRAYGRIIYKTVPGYLAFCLLTAGTPHAFGAELFPFSPPTNKQRTLDAPSQGKPQLSREDIARATRLADQAKKLAPAEQQQFRENILRKQKDAVREGNIAQAQYYTELLTQLRQENR